MLIKRIAKSKIRRLITLLCLRLVFIFSSNSQQEDKHVYFPKNVHFVAQNQFVK